MSERLERIQQNDLLRAINDISLYGPKGIRMEAVIKDIEWLIQQAERVEELEMKLSINTNNMKQLQKENERYKQALEEIRGLYPLRNVGYQVSEIRKIVIKALEGDDD